MSATHITDVLDVAFGRLLSQFKDSANAPLPNAEKLIETLLTEVQDLQHVLYDAIVLRALNTAAGVNLDQYGTLLDENRGGMTDDQYRALLSIKVESNRSTGKTEELISIISKLTTSTDVRIVDIPPAYVEIAYVISPSLTNTQRKQVIRFIDRSRAAGIGVVGIIEAPVNYFGFAEDPHALGFNVGHFTELVT